MNIDDIELPESWEKESKNLYDNLVKAKSHKERCLIMDKNEIWRKLFLPLSNLSNGKCWYSEAQDVMSDRDVDHFRPKKQAKNVDDIARDDEEGYWWLAYDYENYRFSSTYSNQRRKDKFDKKKDTGGKGAYFPLFEGSVVAKRKNQCSDEAIMLLDPCDEEDPSLLTFDETGKAIPNTSAVLDQRDKKRVSVSIQLYHLDHKPLEELREKIWLRCQRKIDEIRKITNDDEISQFGSNRIKFLRNEIREMTKISEELSAVAIACCEENGLGFMCPAR